MFNSIKDISVGKLDDIIVLIKSINKLPTRAGTPYQKIVVRDMEGAEATFVKFDIMFGFEPPIIAKEKIECVEYGASLAIKIKECVGADGYSIENFLPKAQIDAKEGWKKIVSETKSIRKGLSRVVCSVLAEDKTKFLSP